jgi:hypothetical protein
MAISRSSTSSVVRGLVKSQTLFDQLAQVSAPATFELLVVGGGGGGGYNCGGGGGAGQVTYNAAFAKPSGSFTVTVGAGGAAGVPGNSGNGQQGASSVFATVTAVGGNGSAGSFTNGASSGNGYAGGVQYRVDNQHLDGGGGGGASQAGLRGYQTGGNFANSPGPVGGDGLAYSITGVTIYYGGGGNGGVEGAGNNGGWGSYLGYTPMKRSLGGGGWGGGQPFGSTAAAPTAGEPNTGGGGGGGTWDNSNPQASNAWYGAAGGSGIVVVAYPNSYPNITSIGGGLTYTLDTTTRPGFKVYKFTAGTGSVTI